MSNLASDAMTLNTMVARFNVERFRKILARGSKEQSDRLFFNSSRKRLQNWPEVLKWKSEDDPLACLSQSLFPNRGPRGR
jgi:hypothetical protein